MTQLIIPKCQHIFARASIKLANIHIKKLSELVTDFFIISQGAQNIFFKIFEVWALPNPSQPVGSLSQPPICVRLKKFISCSLCASFKLYIMRETRFALSFNDCRVEVLFLHL